MDSTSSSDKSPPCQTLSVKVVLEGQLLDVITFDGRVHLATELDDPTGDNLNDSVVRSRLVSVAFSEPLDPVLASCFVAELKRSRTFYDHFWRNLLLCYVKQRGVQHVDDHQGAVHFKVAIHIQLQSRLQCMECDIRWSNKILSLWTNRLILEDVFSWLSTLGGAYSSLGDYYSNCAVQAGRLSLKQLRLAWILGDPFLQARCMVFLSQSLMQRGYFRLARKIIRRQYQFAISMTPPDRILAAMCEGVWSRLRYSHWKRKVDSGLRVELTTRTLSETFKCTLDVHSNGRCLDKSMTSDTSR